MTTPLAFFNGQLLPQTEASISLHDAGFVWGATITDLVRTVHHQLYRWPEHLARFRASCRAARIYPPFSEEEITRRAQELVEHNAGLLPAESDLLLLLLVTPGPICSYVGQPGLGPPTFIITTFPLPCERYRHLFQQGAHLVIPTTRAIPGDCLEPRLKQRSRLHWWLAEQEAHALDPLASALLLDHDGCITETAAANVLVIQGGRILSPPAERVLAGVCLGVVRELCARLHLEFREQVLTPYDCVNADEMILTSTPYCLAGVSRFNGLPLPWPGQLTQKVLQVWSAELGLDIARQMVA